MLVRFLSPFLPHLLDVGKKAVENVTDVVSGKFGEAAWTKAQRIWGRLHPKLEEKSSVKEAVEDAVKHPDDEDYQAALRVQLKKLLEQDQTLASEIEALMRESDSDGTPGTQIIQSVTGDKNQTIGQVFGGKVVGSVEGDVTM